MPNGKIYSSMYNRNDANTIKIKVKRNYTILNFPGHCTNYTTKQYIYMCVCVCV